MSDAAKIKTPSWDGKTETAPIYICKFEAMCECSDLGAALDDGAVIVTASAYAGETDKTKPECKLYEKNRRAGALYVMGQNSAHGLAFHQNTKSTNHPHGKVGDAMRKLKAKCRPSDTTAEMELDAALEKVQFRDANSYYNSVIQTTAQFSVTKSDTDLIKVMARKVTSPTYTKMIVDHLDDAGTADDLEWLCTQIGTVQRLASPREMARKSRW